MKRCACIGGMGSRTFACEVKNDCSDGSDENECFDATKPHLNNFISKANHCQDGKGLMCKTSPGQPFTCINERIACNEHLIGDEFKCFDTNRNRLYRVVLSKCHF